MNLFHLLCNHSFDRGKIFLHSVLEVLQKTTAYSFGFPPRIYCYPEVGEPADHPHSDKQFA